jgi:hypothetical protein
VNFSILVELSKALSKEDFIARLPDPVLLVLTELDKVEEASGEDDTQVGEEVGSRAGSASSIVPDRFETIAIRKKRHGENKDRITLGRERTCDIVVRTPGISKVHACFLQGDPLRLVDEGSQNGTFLDGKRLEARRPHEVRPGARLVFGDLQTKLIGPDELYALLKSRKS